MAIVGNAPIQYDLSELIDSCDLVVRFNEYSTFGKNAGRKTNILCVCNTGGPAEKMSQNSLILNAPFYSSSLEVWFPRNERIHQAHISRYCPNFNRAKFYQDLSTMLATSNQLGSSQIVAFSADLNEQVFNKLIAKAKWPFVVPSTGFLTVEYILNETRFAEYDKILAGFSFRGWRGHPWEAEKTIVWDYDRTREDFCYIPTYPKLFAPLHNLYSDWMIWKKRRKILKQL